MKYKWEIPNMDIPRLPDVDIPDTTGAEVPGAGVPGPGPFAYYRNKREKRNRRRQFIGFALFVAGLWCTLGSTLSYFSVFFGLIFITVGCSLIAPKFFSKKLAVFRHVLVLVWITPWVVIWIVISIVVVPSAGTPYIGVGHTVPGDEVELSLGTVEVPAILGLYRSTLSTCEFLPNSKQRSWSFNPIVKHRQRTQTFRQV